MSCDATLSRDGQVRFLRMASPNSFHNHHQWTKFGTALRHTFTTQSFPLSTEAYRELLVSVDLELAVVCSSPQDLLSRSRFPKDRVLGFEFIYPAPLELLAVLSVDLFCADTPKEKINWSVVSVHISFHHPIILLIYPLRSICPSSSLCSR